MDIMALGAIGELVGGVAVLVTLLYLALQIRHNTRAVESGTHIGLLEYMGSKEALIVANPEVADLEHRGALRPDELSEVEWRRFTKLALMRFGYWEASFLNHKQGMIDDEMWGAWDSASRMVFDGEGYRRFWREAGPAHAPSFRRYIDHEVIGA